jgi:hypothetical protein
MIFGAKGEARILPTVVLALVAAFIMSVESPIGVLSYSSSGLLEVLVPIAGTFVALSFPAVQLAQSVQRDFFSDARDLFRTKGSDLPGVVSTLQIATNRHRKDLGAMLVTIYLSIASLLLGVAGLFDVAGSMPEPPYFSFADFLASFAAALLVAAALWFIPIVRSSADLSMADETIRLLQVPPPVADHSEGTPPEKPEGADPIG